MCNNCNVSVEEIQAKYAKLIDLVNNTTSLVETASEQGILDSEGIDDYNSLVESVNEVGQIELHEVDNETLKTVMESVCEMRNQVLNLKRVLEEEMF